MKLNLGFPGNCHSGVLNGFRAAIDADVEVIGAIQQAAQAQLLHLVCDDAKSQRQKGFLGSSNEKAMIENGDVHGMG
ncbi:MAG TPA: hypothetical protein P5169_08760 [Kiritimatiellia bacterium]|nr:hypothetical protein [Kiritimatiellia bacterium]